MEGFVIIASEVQVNVPKHVWYSSPYDNFAYYTCIGCEYHKALAIFFLFLLFDQTLRPCLDFFFHNSSLKIPHPVWHHHSLVITQSFSTICGTHSCNLVRAKLLAYPPISLSSLSQTQPSHTATIINKPPSSTQPPASHWATRSTPASKKKKKKKTQRTDQWSPKIAHHNLNHYHDNPHPSSLITTEKPKKKKKNRSA